MVLCDADFLNLLQWGPDPKKKATAEHAETTVQAIGVLRVGDAVPVAWQALSYERPAQPDLLVQLVPQSVERVTAGAAVGGVAKASETQVSEALT